MVFKKISSFLILITILSAQFIQSNNKTDIWLTVFVHGIIKAPWTVMDVCKIARNNVEDSRYRHYADYMRANRDFYRFQPMQEIGLKKVDLNNTFPGNAAGALACIYENLLKNEFANLYYTFGWSGLLSRCHREQESINLLTGLTDELNRLNINPKIRLIGYSHGGNIVLNMAKNLPCNNLPFIVDELILIGTPIQKDTDYLINHPIFKKVYNFYSEGDIAQSADFLTSSYGTSCKKFKNRLDFKLPEKLTQIQIQVTKILYNKYGKVTKVFFKDPTHMELWNFGWAKRVYRCGFPLNPLPTVSLVPFIIESTQSNSELSSDLKIDIRPQLELIKIKDNKTKQKYEVDFPKGKLRELKQMALRYKVRNYSYCDFLELVRNAMNYAYEQLKIRKQNSFIINFY